MTRLTVFHVHDPMCSWCWAYRPVLKDLLVSLQEPPFESLEVKHLVGGLAPDSDVPMSADLAEHLQGIWRRIQSVVPGTEFNFDFWTRTVPRRSTWPACRAVLVAESMAGLGQQITHAIQTAYYLQARNPSDAEVLIDLAGELGLDESRFAQELASASTEAALQEDFATGQALGARGFPSLFLFEQGRAAIPLPLDYNSAASTLNAIRAHL